MDSKTEARIKAKVKACIEREANNIREYCTDAMTGDLNLTKAEEWTQAEWVSVQTNAGLPLYAGIRDIIDQCIFEWADREGLI